MTNTPYGIYQQLRDLGIFSASLEGPMGDPLRPISRLLLGHGHSPRALQPRPPSRRPGLSGLGSPRGARARFSEGAYAIAAAQLRAGPLRRVNSGGREAWVYSNAADVTSSLRDVDGRKGECKPAPQSARV